MHLKKLLQVLLFVSGFSINLASQAQTPWIVGQSVPLTGSNAAFGTDIRDGALAYFKSVNAKGGVEGRLIELVSMDDKNDRKLAGSNTEKVQKTKHQLFPPEAWHLDSGLPRQTQTGRTPCFL